MPIWLKGNPFVLMGFWLNLAVGETGLDFDIFPKQCSYQLRDVLQDNYLPDSKPSHL
jgi:hypothetical protein